MTTRRRAAAQLLGGAALVAARGPWSQAWAQTPAADEAALSGVPAPAAPPAPVRPVQVTDRVWFVEGLAALGSPANRNFISNAGFVVTDAGVVVIDALGSPALADEFLRAIRRVTRQPLHSVIVTHFHADHVYGLQVFKQAGARIVAHQAGREYLQSDTARQRLETSRVELAPWVNDHTQLQVADRWLEGGLPNWTLGSKRGGEDFALIHAGPAHTPEDLMVHLKRSSVLFCGDLVFRGRIPFVGQADSRRWVQALDAVLALKPRWLLPGHGPVSTTPIEDLTLTRDYLAHLRRVMGAAARDMEPFDEAYEKADWSAFSHLPLFRFANRMNAYNTYLLMEREAGQ